MRRGGGGAAANARGGRMANVVAQAAPSGGFYGGRGNSSGLPAVAGQSSGQQDPKRTELLQNLTKEQHHRCRGLIIDLILGTDMGMHQQLKADLAAELSEPALNVLTLA